MIKRGRNLAKAISGTTFLLCLIFAGPVSAQSLPRDEQRFCDAFPSLQQALQQSPAEGSGSSLNQQRQAKKAASGAARDFMRTTGWKTSSHPVKGWVAELNSFAENNEVIGHFAGATVKLPCGDIVVGVPEEAVRKWSTHGMDPTAASCTPGDPYINPGSSLFQTITKLQIGDKVTFAGHFCKVPDSVDRNAIYFVFSKVSVSR